jgi:hypothetical protein
VEWGTIPDSIEYAMPDGGFDIAKGVTVSLRSLLEVVARDASGHPVHVVLEWLTSDAHIASISPDGEIEAKEKGRCEILIRIKGTKIESERIPVQVWGIDHVLLTPRVLDVPLGTRHQITAEVTDEEGKRGTSVLLDWKHDADDPLIVRISRSGLVTGNRLGQTAVTAGAGEIWARIPVEVRVIANPNKPKHGSGFPKLLLTGKDLDPATGMIREGDPDQPPLWQEPSDFIHNVWWLNLQNPEAAFAFRVRGDNPTLWRNYHAGKVVDMVVQVWMSEEFTRKGERQQPEFWAAHLAAIDRHRVRIAQEMWKRLEPHIVDGASLEIEGRDATS